jgi:DNA-binding transcriptional LysR family regulator
MNVAHLRYARAVAREGSFGRAARACSVTQPALSNGIAVLERTLGGRLFDRTTRGVTPTPLGQRLLPLIESTLQGLDTVLAEARLATRQEPRPLRVGVSPLINRELIGRMFEAASAAAPEHAVVLRAGAVSDLQVAVAGAELDLLLIPERDMAPVFRQAIVARDPMVFIAAKAGPAADGPGAIPIELQDTTAVPLILPTDACGLAPFTRRVFADSGLPLPTYPGEAHDCRILQDWVALGLGSALLPGPKVAAGTPARPVQRGEVPVTIAYQACWMATSPLRTEISGLVSMLTAMS